MTLFIFYDEFPFVMPIQSFTAVTSDVLSIQMLVSLVIFITFLTFRCLKSSENVSS